MVDIADGGTAPAGDPSLEALIRSASRRMREALIKWADDDHEMVAMHAPIGLEHIGKAALWKRNPVLLVQLAPNAEESLRILADRPDIANTRLRTIGLDRVLQRLKKCLTSFPLSDDGVRSLVDVRNGSLHVGAPGLSKFILRDALSVCAVCLGDLGTDTADFYGDQDHNVRLILDERRTEVERTVAARMARARNHLAVLEGELGAELFDDTVGRLSDDARLALDPGAFSSSRETIAVDYPCPECGSDGRLIGRLDAEQDIDWEIGDANEFYAAGASWDLRMSPYAFGCNVCKLWLQTNEELSAAHVRSSAYTLEPSELDDDFDLDAFARRQYDDWD